MFQNKRLPAVLKNSEESKPYYVDAIVWREDDGSTFTGSVLDSKGGEVNSCQNIRLPFTPKTFYIDVYEKYDEYWVKNDDDLDKVWEYYDKE